MTRKELTELAYKVDTDDDRTLFVSSFADNRDAEIVAVIAAWLSIGQTYETHTLCTTVDEIMHRKPYEYIQTHTHCNDVAKNKSFFCVLTYSAFDNLCECLRNTRNMQHHYNEYMKRYGNKYSHDALAQMFNCAAMFTPPKENSTYYRFNLLFYWLTYKLRIWNNADTTHALLPCNDFILESAYTMGITKKHLRTTLPSAVTLTRKAREWFGDENFYKMYELLNFNK